MRATSRRKRNAGRAPARVPLEEAVMKNKKPWLIVGAGLLIILMATGLWLSITFLDRVLTTPVAVTFTFMLVGLTSTVGFGLFWIRSKLASIARRRQKAEPLTMVKPRRRDA